MPSLDLHLAHGTGDDRAGHLVAPDGRFLLADDPLLAATGSALVTVAGRRWQRTTPRPEALTPGAPLAVVHEPENPFDHQAVAVFAAEDRQRIGYVPAQLSPRVAAGLRAGLHLTATVVAHVADRLEVLIAPPELLRVRPVDEQHGIGLLHPDGRVTVVTTLRRYVLVDEPLAQLALKVAGTGDGHRLDTALRWLSRDVSETLGVTAIVKYPASRRVR